MKDQKGTTLVSVIVSFAVLMVVMLLLQVSISASGRYAARAEEIWKQVETAENKYVNGESYPYMGSPHFPQVDLVMICNESEEEWGSIYINCTSAPPQNDGDEITFYYAIQNP